MAVTVPPLRKANRKTSPSLAFERELWAEGHDVVIGVDEVGRGAWAGPITVGAAVLPSERRVYKVRESKMLTESEREAFYDRLVGWCRAWGVGHASQEECDALGMSEAQRLAARRALEQVGLRPDVVLIDGRWDFVGLGNSRRLVKGDARCLSIATASILAKVTRDRHMRRAADLHPSWDFDTNVGYSTPEHRAAIAAHGISPIHRRSFASIAYQQLSLGR